MLFVGVTILLASTYVTMTTQEKLVQQESVVKRAQSIHQHLDKDNFDLQLKPLLGTVHDAAPQLVSCTRH